MAIAEQRSRRHYDFNYKSLLESARHARLLLRSLPPQPIYAKKCRKPDWPINRIFTFSVSKQLLCYRAERQWSCCRLAPIARWSQSDLDMNPSTRHDLLGCKPSNERATASRIENELRHRGRLKRHCLARRAAVALGPPVRKRCLSDEDAFPSPHAQRIRGASESHPYIDAR
jgi:hypothetical protein